MEGKSLIDLLMRDAMSMVELGLRHLPTPGPSGFAGATEAGPVVDWQAGPRLIYRVPEEMLVQVGRIGIFWGAVDGSVVHMMKACLIENGHDPAKQWVPGFEKRLKLFRKEMQRTFAGYPIIIAAYDHICREADALAQTRNTLLHGKTVWGMHPTLGPVIEAHGRRQTILVNLAQLTEIALRIEHLAALLSRPGIVSDKLVDPEKSILLDFERRHSDPLPTSAD